MIVKAKLQGFHTNPYKTEDEAVKDAFRLARGMTYKAAAAGLNLGGGKFLGQVRAPPRLASALASRRLASRLRLAALRVPASRSRESLFDLGMLVQCWILALLAVARRLASIATTESDS